MEQSSESDASPHARAAAAAVTLAEAWAAFWDAVRALEEHNLGCRHDTTT